MEKAQTVKLTIEVQKAELVHDLSKVLKALSFLLFNKRADVIEKLSTLKITFEALDERQIAVCIWVVETVSSNLLIKKILVE